MMERGFCQCGCGGETPLYADPKNPGRPGKPNRFIKGHYGQVAHRLKAERALGHPIPKGVETHHHGIPGDYHRNYNSLNLVLCENHKYHCYLHMREKAYFASKGIECPD